MSVIDSGWTAKKVDAAIAKGIIVKKGASSDGYVQKATAASDKLVGITQDVTTAADQDSQIAVDGPAKILVAESVVFGDFLTADADGKGIKPNNANENIVAKCMQDGSAGDLIACVICFGKATVAE